MGLSASLERFFPRPIRLLLVIFCCALLGWLLTRSFAYQWHWETIPKWTIVIKRGLLTTLFFSVGSIFFASILGVLLSLLSASRIPVIRDVYVVFIEIVRNTPLLVQILIGYFVIGSIFNLSAIVAGIATLSIFTSAYVAEIIRGGIESVDKGQREAAYTLGMSGTQTTWLIVMPQAIKVSLPALTGQLVSTIKDSSLLSVIAVQELTLSTQQAISNSAASFEFWSLNAILYFIICFPLSRLVGHLEKRMKRRVS